MDAERPTRAAYRFDRFTLDLARGALLAADGSELPLRPKSFALLRLLVENAGRLLDRDAIMGAVWPEVFVTDSSIAQCVRDIRRTLGDEAGRLLRTVPRRGYLFNAEVSASVPPGGERDVGQAVAPLLADAAEPAAAATRSEVEHRLRAIVAADVVGYARHMEDDEAGTVARLEHLRHGVIDVLAVARGGRVTSAAGDGFILAFPSAAEAVAFAIDLQARLAEQAEDARPLLMRAGVNIGDVIVRGGDVAGDAVNVAARLEAAAEPGGVLVNDAALSLARGRVPVTFAPVGKLSLKNLSRPVEAWHWHPRGHPYIRRALGGEAGRLLWPVPRRGDLLAAEVTHADFEGPPAADGGRPFLVVLPFSNQGEDDWFADGVTEDLITGMARSLPRAGWVVARGTSFALKGRVGDPREAGRELGVRYTLDGRVRRRGERVRIVAKLVDTATGAIAWTQTFDGDRADLALGRDEIVARIGNALRYEVVTAAGERARRKAPREIVADDLVMQGWATFYRPRSVGQLRAACELFEQASAAGPCSGDVGLALTHTYLALGMDTCPDRHLEEAGRALERARSAPPPGAAVPYAEGLLLRARGEWKAACRSFERAIGLDPNDPYARIQLGFAHRCAGQPERLFPLMDEAVRLSPYDPEMPLWFNYAALACFDLGRLDEGVGWASKAVRLNPALFYVYFDAAAELARAGRVDEARAWVTAGLSAGLIRTVRDYTDRFGYLRKGDYAPRFRQFLDGLHLAGLPVE